MALDARTSQYTSDENPLGEVKGQMAGMYYCWTCDVSVTTAGLLHKVWKIEREGLIATDDVIMLLNASHSVIDCNAS